MSSVVISGNTSGTITLDAPNVAGTTVLTLPTANGTVLTTANTFGAGTGPAFSARRESTQTFTSSTFTKVLLNVEDFDTNNNFASSTFTPTVAGYYQLNGSITMQSTSTNNRQILAFFKNNSQILRPVDYRMAYTTDTANYNGSGLIYMNGTTDYVELFVYVTGSGTLSIIAPAATECSTFSGFLARAA